MQPRRMKGLLRTAVATGAAMALVGGTASGATGAVVVPPGGTAGGKDYAQWLATWWQVRLKTPPSGSICQQSGGVGVLIGGPVPPGVKRCSAKAGQTIYVPGPSGECSTIEKAPSHGSTDAQLKRCARKSFAATGPTTVTLDGTSVGDVSQWVVATGVFRVHLPKTNILGAKKRRGRSAAYGVGFLLTGLAIGTHTIRESGSQGGHKVTLTYEIEVT